MKSFKNFIFTIVLTIILTSIILNVASKVFIPKWIDAEGNRMSYIIKGFYREPKNSIDVLFTGNSDVYRGVSPMTIYENSGITSYNFVAAGQRMWVGYTMLEEALRYQSPKVVFFNTDELYFTSPSNGNTHKVYDNMSFGLPKIKGIFDPNYENPGRLAHFLPILAYHDRYKELTLNDFKYAYADYTDPLKGLDLVATSKSYYDTDDYMKKSNEIATIPEKNIDYLDKMRKLCEENDIELVLFQLPSSFEWTYKKHNAVEEYAQKYGLKFIDFNLLLKDIDFDWTTDSADAGEHLNIYGAEKVSTYLADFLKDNYSLKDHRQEEKYDYWNEQYKEYLNFKEKVIDELQD